MPTFVKSVIIDAPVETVFAFHERPDALSLLSPAFPRARVVRQSGGIEPGSIVELRIGPVAWVARHTAYEKNRLFVDEQTEGPFRSWIHRHEFEDLGVSARLTDRIEYQVVGGRVVEILFGWAVNLGLRWMFQARHRTTRRYCEGKKERAG